MLRTAASRLTRSVPLKKHHCLSPEVLDLKVLLEYHAEFTFLKSGSVRPPTLSFFKVVLNTSAGGGVPLIFHMENDKIGFSISVKKKSLRF